MDDKKFIWDTTSFLIVNEIMKSGAYLLAVTIYMKDVSTKATITTDILAQ